MKLLNGYKRQSHDMKWFTNREWLSNLDIDHVLNYVSDKNKNYFHAGTYAKDFQSIVNGKCISDKCDLQMLPNMDDGVQYISFVLNTDVSSGPGIHWFCIFVDLLRGEVYVYDPASAKGNFENKYVDKLLNNISKKFSIDSTAIFKNRVQKQPANSGECGIYVLYFILKMIEYSKMYPIDTECNNTKTQKMWKNKNQKWENEEKEGSEYFPWFNPIARTLHKKKNDHTVYCGRPFDIFSTSSCFPDISKFNQHMADYIRQSIFCIEDQGVCMEPNENSQYAECSFMDVSSKDMVHFTHKNFGGRYINAEKLNKNVFFKQQ